MSVLTQNPTFNSATKTLDFSAITGFDIKRLALVTDLTANTVIYAFNGDVTNGGSFNATTKVLTLVFNTTALANTDVLRCDYSAADIIPAVTTSVSTGTDGLALDLNSLAQTLVYNGDGTLNYIQVVSGANTYRQTFSYTTGVVTGISAFVKQ